MIDVFFDILIMVALGVGVWRSLEIPRITIHDVLFVFVTGKILWDLLI